MFTTLSVKPGASLTLVVRLHQRDWLRCRPAVQLSTRAASQVLGDTGFVHAFSFESVRYLLQSAKCSVGMRMIVFFLSAW